MAGRTNAELRRAFEGLLPTFEHELIDGRDHYACPRSDCDESFSVDAGALLASCKARGFTSAACPHCSRVSAVPMGALRG